MSADLMFQTADMIDLFPLLTLFLVALSYGATACMFSCMPLLSPILLANDATRSQSLRVLLPITAGRITGYTLLSLAAFAGSFYLRQLLRDPSLMGYLLGSTTLFLAFRLWITQRRSQGCCSDTSRQNGTGGFIPLFLSGVFLSLSLCAPVATMMTLSASASSPGMALAYGIVFGLGATLLWLLFFSVAMTHILKESLVHLHAYRDRIRQAAPILLALIGIALFNGWIRL